MTIVLKTNAVWNFKYKPGCREIPTWSRESNGFLFIEILGYVKAPLKDWSLKSRPMELSIDDV